MKRYLIRRAEKSDMQGMLEVLRSANMHHIPSEEVKELNWQNCFVAVHENSIIGMSGYEILTKERAKTTLMAVLPGYRGWGIGLALQKTRMDALIEHGISLLVTNADRPETIKWYKKHFGYREMGSLPKIHEFGHPDIDTWTTLETNLKEWQVQSEKIVRDL